MLKGSNLSSKIISRLAILALLVSTQSSFVAAQKKMLLIGGGTSLCSSAAESNCDVKLINWEKLAKDQGYPSNVRVKKTDLLQVTAASLIGLRAKKDYPSWAIDDLQKLGKSEYTTDDFKKEMDKIDRDFVDTLSDDNWEATLNYLAVKQTEIVSFEHSPVYSKDLFNKFVEISGGRKAVIGIVSSSSQDDRDSYEFYKAALLQDGIQEAVWIPIDLALREARNQRDCDNIDYYVGTTYGEYDVKRRYPELNDQQIQACKYPEQVYTDLNRITGIFFTGGDQSKHKASFIDSKGDSAEMAIIRKRVNSGDLALSGTSAGTAVLGGSPDSGIPMIAGGESYEALTNKPLDHICVTSLCSDDLQYDPEGGLNLFTVGILDTHFSQRGRQGRLVRLARHSNVGLAFGVDETTGLLALSYGDSTDFQVIGQYGVTFFDLRDSKGSDSKASTFSVTGVSLNYFTDGDTFSISSTGKIQTAAASYKKKVVERGRSSTTTDIFDSPNRSGGRASYLEFINIDTGLIESADTSTYGETYETKPSIYKVNFTKLKNTQGYKGTDRNGDDRFTILDLDISIQPKTKSQEENFIQKALRKYSFFKRT